MTRILWAGPRCDLAAAVERASYDVVYAAPGTLPEAECGVVVATRPWPPEVALPTAAVVFCLSTQELAALDPELAHRAAAILVNPVKPSTLLRELESLLGVWWDFHI